MSKTALIGSILGVCVAIVSIATPSCLGESTDARADGSDASAPDAPSRDASTADVPLACNVLCGEAVKTTNCPNEDPVAICMDRCLLMVPLLDCVAAAPWISCIDQLGEYAYECTADGAKLRTDICQNEWQTAEQCSLDGGSSDKYARCSDDSGCPLTMGDCLRPMGKPGMCSRTCEEDIHCPTGDHCVINTPAEIGGYCFAGCENKSCPAGTSCIDWGTDPSSHLICVPSDWQ